MRSLELIRAELRSAELEAELAQVGSVLTGYQFREAQMKARSLAAELQAAGRSDNGQPPEAHTRPLD